MRRNEKRVKRREWYCEQKWRDLEKRGGLVLRFRVGVLVKKTVRRGGSPVPVWDRTDKRRLKFTRPRWRMRSEIRALRG